MIHWTHLPQLLWPIMVILTNLHISPSHHCSTYLQHSIFITCNSHSSTYIIFSTNNWLLFLILFTWPLESASFFTSSTSSHLCFFSLGPFHEAIAVPSVTRCRCRRWRHGHWCTGGTRLYRWRHLVNGREAACGSEWAQHFSNASCSRFTSLTSTFSVTSLLSSITLSLCLSLPS